MSKGRTKLIKRLKEDFIFFAERCLKITDKEANILPFKLNPSQLILQSKLKLTRESITK